MNLQNIRKIIKQGEILENEPMRLHTSFRVGGPARFMIRPQNRTELAGLIRYLESNGLPYFVLGNGSNLLVSDRGYAGTVVDLGRHDGTEFTMLGIDDKPDPALTALLDRGDSETAAPGSDRAPILFEAGTGCLLSSVGQFAARFSASGFEALWGIPGCIGGAVVMNAGAYGSEIKDVLCALTVVTRSGRIERRTADAFSFGYRHSSIMDAGEIVVSAELILWKDEEDAIRARMEDYRRRRAEKQPLELPSAGSTFKRPEGHFAGQLIDEAGLRGFAIGGAAVSTKHAGFIVNQGGATADEIYRLIGEVRERVRLSSGITLVPELRFLGDFS